MIRIEYNQIPLSILKIKREKVDSEKKGNDQEQIAHQWINTGNKHIIDNTYD